MDATPPAYDGVILIDELKQARNSENPTERSRDMFFAGSPIKNKRLKLNFPCTVEKTSFYNSEEFLRRSAREYLTLCSDDEWLLGSDGIHKLAEIVGSEAFEEHEDIFVASGSILAARSRHGRVLRRAYEETQKTQYLNLSDSLSDIASQWAAVRILCSREARLRRDTVNQRLSKRLGSIATAEAAVSLQLTKI